jgi:glycosyltransferase involved in cell wall biosynthesis
LNRASFNPFGDLTELLLPWRVLRLERPQIVFAHGLKPVIYGTLLGWMARVPRRVAMIPGLGYSFTSGAGLKRRIARLVGGLGYRLALAQAHVVIFHNADDRAALFEAGALRRGTPTVVVNGSGIDLTRFSPAPLPAGPSTFLMVARLLHDKGVREFVEAARRVKVALPEAQFVLVGDADPHNPAAVAAEQIAAWRAEGIVEIRGHMADPRPEYAACHVFVLPSYREGTPRTNLEAMATGRAIITTDVPGCRQTVTHGVNGLLVPARDPEALAAAMLELARDPDRVRKMGEAGLQRCQRSYELNAVTQVTADAVEGTVVPDAEISHGGPRDARTPTPLG